MDMRRYRDRSNESRGAKYRRSITGSHCSVVSIYEDYFDILDIIQKQASDIVQLKSAYKRQIYKNNKNRQKRVLINQAYFMLSRKIYQIDQPQNQLLKAILKGKKKKVQSILSKKKQMLNYRTKGDKYPILYHAVRAGHYDIVQLILEMGCSLDFSKDISTPMHCAAYYGHYCIIPLLLRYGVPINIKNSFENLPVDQACDQKIKTLLQNANKDKISELFQKLLKQNKAINIISIKDQKQVAIKKIILKNYQSNFKQYDDAFHGTSFQNLQSIAQHGLKKPGDQVGDKTLQVVDGHIDVGQTVNGIDNWSNAVFVSPSIYYAADPAYALQHINNENQVWLPIVQVKVKKGTYTKHDHTFLNYDLKSNEPSKVQYRVVSQIQDQTNLVIRAPNPQNVVAVALIFLKKGFLDENDNFYKTTAKILFSPEETKFEKNHTFKPPKSTK